MIREIKDRNGYPLGRAIENAGGNLEYYTYGRDGGLIGIWYPSLNQYIAYGRGGNGMIAQSDIGSGEVYRVYHENNR